VNYQYLAKDVHFHHGNMSLGESLPKCSAHNQDVAGNGQSNILYNGIMQQLALIFPNTIFVYNMTIAQHLCFVFYYQPKFKWKVRKYFETN
jgi:hypothetical protein